MTRLVRIAVAGLLVLGTVGAAAAGPATDHVHESIDAVLKVLTDPDLKTSANTVERRRAIRTVANELFDFAELSRRSLATHWAARTPAERQEFIALFTDLLENSYITTIEEYTGETILLCRRDDRRQPGARENQDRHAAGDQDPSRLPPVPAGRALARG